MIRRKLGLLLAIFALSVLAGCHKDKGPLGATTYTDLTGTYRGVHQDTTGTGIFTWVLTQSGADVTGTCSATTASEVPVFEGTVSGTLNGATLTYTITIPVGGIYNEPTCSATATGTATNTRNYQINGTYTGTNTCNGPFTQGSLTLYRQ